MIPPDLRDPRGHAGPGCVLRGVHDPRRRAADGVGARDGDHAAVVAAQAGGPVLDLEAPGGPAAPGPASGGGAPAREHVQAGAADPAAPRGGAHLPDVVAQLPPAGHRQVQARDLRPWAGVWEGQKGCRWV